MTAKFIVVDRTAGVNPYLTYDETMGWVWGSHKDDAYRFDDLDTALAVGQEVMSREPIAGAEKRIAVQTVYD